MRPGRTGYSPLTIWTSVPQMVVTVMRITASPGFGRGLATSSTRISLTPWKTTAFIVFMTASLSMRRGELLRRPPLDGPKKRHDRVDPHRRVGARILPAEHVAPDRHRPIA